jgi:hypothetical protein
MEGQPERDALSAAPGGRPASSGPEKEEKQPPSLIPIIKETGSAKNSSLWGKN